MTQKIRERSAQRQKLSVWVAIEANGSVGGLFYNFERYRLGDSMGVLVHIELYRHINLRCAIGNLSDEVGADWQIFEVGHL
jgi:hypothetical protein